MTDIVGNRSPDHNLNEALGTPTVPMVGIPSVVDSKTPKEGMSFISVDDAFKFYNEYAKEAGFGVRKSSNRIDKKTGEEYFKTFVCHKEGSVRKKSCDDTTDEGPKRRRTIIREQCHALLSVKKNEQGLWTVVKYVEGHSHGLLSPSKTQFLSSHREVSVAQRRLLNTLGAVNVGTSQTMSLMDIEAGGHEHVGLQVRDLYNAKRDDKEDKKGYDAQTLIEMFDLQKEKNQAFFYRYEVDSDSCLTRIFWADPTCRLNYGFFGDVVVFDTTYKTNKYGMIFAPFTGVNHHYQSIYFGFGFLRDETADSFCWLFKTFIECMPGDAPKSIITDQDPAMAKAIPLVFSNTFHIWCIWHITQKLPIKLGCQLYKGEFASSFHDLVLNCETPKEFEEEWPKLLSLYQFDDHKWLMDLYEKRHMWVNAYLKHTFFAGMISSQRSESHHNALKKYVSPRHSLLEFFSGLKLALSNERTKELQADQQSFTGKPKLKTPSLLEEYMTGVYTNHIFYMFQDELIHSGFGYSMHMDSEDDNMVQYIVRRILINNKGRKVIMDKKSKHLTCSCQMFEFKGIPCRHLLLVFKMIGINDLPSRYILKRWCKDAKKRSVIDSCGDEIIVKSHDPQLSRFRELRYESDNLAKLGCTSEENCELMKKIIQKTLDEFKDLTSLPTDHHKDNEGENNVDNAGHLVESLSSVNEGTFVNEPSQCRPKGCGERLKSRLEKIIPKARLCRACGKRGVQHDSRNCPGKQKWEHDNEGNVQSLSEDES